MALFLGYDPGGHGKNGVAAAIVEQDGSLGPLLHAEVVDHADAALRWFGNYRGERPIALGVDTLLAWSKIGKRLCDSRLRQHYGTRAGRSVIDQNSLYSSMTVNGTIVALLCGLPLCESHPKLLCNAGLLPESLTQRLTHSNDHASDALIAAWCASRWYFGKWVVDLFDGDPELVFPAGAAVYPWPEELG